MFTVLAETMKNIVKVWWRYDYCKRPLWALELIIGEQLHISPLFIIKAIPGLNFVLILKDFYAVDYNLFFLIFQKQKLNEKSGFPCIKNELSRRSQCPGYSSVLFYSRNSVKLLLQQDNASIQNWALPKPQLNINDISIWEWPVKSSDVKSSQKNLGITEEFLQKPKAVRHGGWPERYQSS